VGPVGSGVSTAAKLLRDNLSNVFDYDVAPIIKLSNFIKNEARRVEMGKVPDNLSGYISHMQDAGNKLRKKFGGNYLAEKAVERIATYRREKNGYAENGTMLPGRRAYIIDSIKNLEELELLKQIYGRTLLLIGVFAPDQIRKTRLINDGALEDDVRAVLDRDSGEVATFGQNDLLPDIPSFIRRVCSSFAPVEGVLRTRMV
jgi:dephospho-CoA kinase